MNTSVIVTCILVYKSWNSHIARVHKYVVGFVKILTPRGWYNTFIWYRFNRFVDKTEPNYAIIKRTPGKYIYIKYMYTRISLERYTVRTILSQQKPKFTVERRRGVITVFHWVLNIISNVMSASVYVRSNRCIVRSTLRTISSELCFLFDGEYSCAFTPVDNVIQVRNFYRMCTYARV